MKSTIKIVISIFWLAVMLTVAGAQTGAQTGADSGTRLQIGQLDRLASKAAQYVNVNVDERLLRFAQAALSSSKPEEREVKEVVAGLRGVYVKRFEFDTEGAYSASDVEAVRAQLRAPNWSRIVEVRSRRATETVEVYLSSTEGRIDGLAILSTQPTELMVINIVGMIDLEKLAKLRGQFGVPEDLDFERKADDKPRTKKQ